MRRFSRTLFAILLAAAAGLSISPFAGCRAIRQHVESRSGIHSRKLSRMGLEAMHQQRWGAAEEHFAAALDLDDSDDRAHWGMAETLWQRGEREKAIEHMEQAVRLSAAEPELLIRLGRMYLDVGRITEAQERSDEALVSGREYASAWALQGDVMAATANDSQALSAYHRALAVQPNYPDVQIAIADLYRRQGRYDRLLATLDRLQDDMELTGCPIRVQQLRGIAMKELGRPREAADCFMAVCQCNPNDPQNLLMLAEAELEAGNTPAARHALELALQIDQHCSGAEAIVARLQQAEQGRF